MARGSDGRVALMSLHPQHAEAILAGWKTVEFRRRAFGQRVARVVIYATQPVARVVGSFDVGHVDVASPAELWERHGQHGAITRCEFDRYFEGSPTGAAIEVRGVSRLRTDMPLSAVAPGVRPPQSFVYLDGAQVVRGADVPDPFGALPGSMLSALYEKINLLPAMTRIIGAASILFDIAASLARGRPRN